MATPSLPQHYKAFNSKEYWKKFFEERQEAFEWYGSYTDLKGIFTVLIRPKERLLVVGCGNSSLSAELHDDGFPNVTSMDYEEQVIAEMKKLHSVTRPMMRWDVMDMTRMDGYADGSFDVVIDKGAMDALVSDDSPAALASAEAMLREVGRVLSPGGRYVCVTLAQDFILRSMVDFLTVTSSGWQVELHAISASRPSPYLPFLLIARKSTSTTSSTKVCFQSAGASVVDVSVDASITCPTAGSFAELCLHVQSAQQAHRRGVDLSVLKPGRCEEEALWSATNNDVPRYTLFIVDVTDASAAHDCAVVIIPRGRETEFTFSSQEGLTALAGSASCRRLVAVRMNRGHDFSGMDDVKAELAGSLRTFAPHDRVGGAIGVGGGGASSIPIMAVSTDVDCGAVVVAEGTLACSGPYVVEEVEEEDEDHPGRYVTVRQLIFMRHQGIIQTQVALQTEEMADDQGLQSGAGGKSSKGKAGNKGGGKKGKSKAKKKQANGHTAAAAAAGRPGGAGTVSGYGHEAENGEFVPRVMAGSLTFGYHKCMVAGAALALGSKLSANSSNSALSSTSNGSDGSSLSSSSSPLTESAALTPPPPPLAPSSTPSSLPSLSSSSSSSSSSPSCLVIGLGGGALPMALRYFYPDAHILVCELDGEIAGLAKEWFGFVEDERMHVVVEDGLKLVERLAVVAAPPPTTSESSSSSAAAAAPPPMPVAKEGGNIIETAKTEGGEKMNGDGGSGGGGGTDLPANMRPPYSAIFVDVDSKDATVGMSCPPRSFVEEAFLRSLRSLLQPDGMLTINIAARSPALYEDALRTVVRVFAGDGEQVNSTSAKKGASKSSSSSGGGGGGGGEVMTLKACDDDVNTTVFAFAKKRRASKPLKEVATKIMLAGRSEGGGGGGGASVRSKAEVMPLANLLDQMNRVKLS